MVTSSEAAQVLANLEPVVPRCHLPWQEMIIQADGTVEPCCYWTAHGNANKPLGNVNDKTINEIWNDAPYRELRRNMACGDLKAAGCANCYALKQGMKMGLEYDHDADLPENRDAPYARNIATLKSEIAAGAERLSVGPTIISATVSHKCNLACTHCYQNSSRDRQWTRPGVFAEIEALVPTLVRLIAGGGEPLLLSRWRKFIAAFDPVRAPFLNFGMTTNATVIKPDVLSGLQKFRSLHIIISMDGASADVYDRIRINASFAEVEKNIFILREAVERRPKTSVTTFGLCVSVMKSNIRHLPEFVAWAARHGLAFSIHPVLSMPYTESLAAFNDPDTETAGWREAIEAARVAVRDASGDNLPQVWKDAQQQRGRAARHAWPFFEPLEAFIPWDAPAFKHYDTTFALPAASMAAAGEWLVRPTALVALTPTADTLVPSGITTYYARVGADGIAQLKLPFGSFHVCVCDEFEIGEGHYVGMLNVDGLSSWFAKEGDRVANNTNWHMLRAGA